MKLSLKVAIVTGSSRGIGKATAKLFAQEGASVTITGKDPKRLEDAKKEIGNVLAVPADIDRKSTRLNSSHIQKSRMPSSA